VPKQVKVGKVLKKWQWQKQAGARESRKVTMAKVGMSR